MNYQVNDIYATIQGEGVWTGTPMILVRLQGCPVGCPFCDTKETWEANLAYRVPTIEAARSAPRHWCEMSEVEVCDEVRRIGEGASWVLLTGGEPANQELYALASELYSHRYKICLETSGTADCHIGSPIYHICVSPKIEMPGGRPIKPLAVASADEIKFVIGKADDIAKIDAFISLYNVQKSTAISLQPMSQSARATKLCIQTALARGWRVSLQTHKYMEVR